MRTVLFVCTGNYYRSRYAELRFNALVPAESGWRADSRGFALSPRNQGPISPYVGERLARSGLPAEGDPRAPQTLTEVDLEAADLVVALDVDEHTPYVQRLFPQWAEHFTYWQVADLHAMTVAEALGALDDLVDGLIADL